MRRTLVLLAAAVAGIGSLVAIESSAAYGGTGIDASNYAITCTNQTGGVTFNPVLRSTGSTIGSDTVKVTTTLSGCTATPPSGGQPITVSKGVVTGTLVGAVGNSCSTVFSGGINLPFVGSLSIKWKTSPKISSGNTHIAMQSGSVGLVGPGPMTTLMFPGASDGTVTGSFSANSSESFSYSVSSDTPLTLYNACWSAKGLKKIPGSSGLVDLGSPPSSLSVVCPTTTIVMYPDEGGSCQAFGSFPGNPSLDITSLAQWTSSDPSVATIGGDSLDGILITPTGPGTTSIQGSYGGKSAAVSITIEQPPTITTTSLPDAQVGVPYDFTLAADNGTPPYVWQIESSFFTETGLTSTPRRESSRERRRRRARTRSAFRSRTQPATSGCPNSTPT